MGGRIVIRARLHIGGTDTPSKGIPGATGGSPLALMAHMLYSTRAFASPKPEPVIDTPRIRIRGTRTVFVDGEEVKDKNALTATEKQVLTWLSHGKHYEDISELLGMTKNAVHQHAHHMMNKLGASSAAGAVGAGLRRGLIE